MNSRSMGKVVSVFHRLFRNGEKDKDGAVGQGNGSGGRHLMRHHMVTPAEMKQPEASSGQGKVNTLFKKSPPQTSESGTSDIGFPKSVRSRRLMKELHDIKKSQTKDPPFTVELINDNLYDWHVRLYSVDSESDLAADMREHGVNHISLQLTFPENYPFVPPFMRVVSPRIEKGFVMEGGAICMELLTPRGWASGYTVEAIVMQFAASIVKGQGRISKKTKSSSKEFNRRSAEESFRSLVKTHDKYGWITPPLADGVLPFSFYKNGSSTKRKGQEPLTKRIGLLRVT
ncbi:ubiquitin-conjugating enzyme E2Q-like protein 1 isoform X1 [Halyomorpha halys]|uniref:ubiquitin-conjugating enzyme E2Q-like protein 1 isoform X1 n=2 Tax=Halyomorpha halys TaxID=286706 RepID=UPI0034D38522